MVHDDVSEQMRQLRQALGRKMGLPETTDSYFFLVRIGANYSEYPFNWEPFRDLAGPLRPGSGSLPVVVISDSTARRTPEIVRAEHPIAHYEFRVSPTIPVEVIANAWLELLVDNGALYGTFTGPFKFFTGSLHIAADQLSDKGRSFIGL
jgi:hypothetical protein